MTQATMNYVTRATSARRVLLSHADTRVAYRTCRVCGMDAVFERVIAVQQTDICPQHGAIATHGPLRYERPELRDRQVLVVPDLSWWERLWLWWDDLRTWAGW